MLTRKEVKARRDQAAQLQKGYEVRAERMENDREALALQRQKCIEQAHVQLGIVSMCDEMLAPKAPPKE